MFVTLHIRSLIRVAGIAHLFQIFDDSHCFFLDFRSCLGGPDLHTKFADFGFPLPFVCDPGTTPLRAVSATLRKRRNSNDDLLILKAGVSLLQRRLAFHKLQLPFVVQFRQQRIVELNEEIALFDARAIGNDPEDLCSRRTTPVVGVSLNQTYNLGRLRALNVPCDRLRTCRSPRETVCVSKLGSVFRKRGATASKQSTMRAAETAEECEKSRAARRVHTMDASAVRLRPPRPRLPSSRFITNSSLSSRMTLV